MDEDEIVDLSDDRHNTSRQVIVVDNMSIC